MNYHDRPEMSQSKLKLLWDDPALFAEIYIHKTRPQPAPTPAMQFGIDCERYLFTGGFGDVQEIPSHALNADGHRKGKAWQEWCASQPDGARLMKSPEFKEFMEPFYSIHNNVAECQPVKDLLCGGERKRVILWSYLGVELKSEIDILHEHCIVDLKTCSPDHIDGEGFSRHCVSYGWHIQAASYQLAVEQETGKLLPFVFVAIANKPSYRVETYQLHEDFMQSGRQQFGDMIEFYKDCLERNHWHSETWGQLNIIKAPRWFEAQQQDWSVA